MFYVKQSESTAARRRVPVYLVDSTDGYTPETGVASPTVEVSKNGGAQASGTGTWAEVGDGVYTYEFASGEIDTLGWINLRVVKSSVSREFQAIVLVTAYDAFDGVRLGLSALPNAAAGANGGLPTGNASGQVAVASLAANSITASVIATDAIDADALAADAVTEIQSGITSLDAAGVRAAVGLAFANLDTQLAAIDDAVDTEVAAILAAVDTEVAAIKAKTDNLPADPADQSDLAALIGALPSAAAIADAVWDEVQSGHTTNGTFGKYLDAQVSAISGGGGGSAPTAEEVADAVWAKTMTELSAVPGVTGTTLEALSWVFTLLRNKRTQTSTTETVYKDDGSTALATSTKSDASGTFTRGEYS